MKVYTTKKQCLLVRKALPVMAQLYRNEFEPLLRMIAETYGNDPRCAAKAATILQQTGVTAAAPLKAERLDALATDWELETQPVSDPVHPYCTELDSAQVDLLSKTLDAFSRITMGQLHILFEVLDVPPGFSENPHALCTYQDVYWDGKHGGKEARDILFPEIRNFGWFGGYGISNPDVSEDSRLAYQISRALSRDYVLPVTKEPLARVE